MDTGEGFNSPAGESVVGHALIDEQHWRAVANRLHLCSRELQIVQLVFDDKKEGAIANTLGISPHTVNSYLQRLYHKIQVRSRPQLILRVMAAYLAPAAAGANDQLG